MRLVQRRICVGKEFVAPGMPLNYLYLLLKYYWWMSMRMIPSHPNVCNHKAGNTMHAKDLTNNTCVPLNPKFRSTQSLETKKPTNQICSGKKIYKMSQWQRREIYIFHSDNSERERETCQGYEYINIKIIMRKKLHIFQERRTPRPYCMALGK